MKNTQNELKNLFKKVSFHGYTVWCCPDTRYCGAYYNNWHEKCKHCGKYPLEAAYSKYPAPED